MIICSYFLVILRSRYFKALYVLDPREWLVPSAAWPHGTGGSALLMGELALLCAPAAAELFEVLASRLSDATGTVESAAQGFFETRLWQASCKAAIKGGRLYDGASVRWICDRLLQKPDARGAVIRTCPHGRPVAFEIRKTAIDRQFGRLG